MNRRPDIRLLLFLTIFCIGVVFPQSKPIKDLRPTVILLSIDGFRYDYLDKYRPKTLGELAKNGVRARWLIPSFPTKTFPNHYTIATGLYPENHDIIENNIYDAGFDAVFGLSKREEVQNPRWWSGEPVWVTAQKQGKIAASFFFPGTETQIKGVRPAFWKEYDGTIPNERRVDQVLEWLDLSREKRPVVYTLYFSDIDDAGHAFSPDSEEVGKAVEKVDGDVRRLLDGLTKRKIDKKVNLIIVSDHGMVSVAAENSVVLDDFFDFDLTERMLWTGEIVQIFPKAGKTDAVMSGLKNMPHAECWRKPEIPERLHYRKSPRIAPVVCSAEEGFYMTSRERLEQNKKRPDWGRTRGAHGYDNKYQSMQATFIAHGADFKKGYIAEPFENVHIYNLMCYVLGLFPAKNDGDLKAVKEMLLNPPPPKIKVHTK